MWIEVRDKEFSSGCGKLKYLLDIHMEIGCIVGPGETFRLYWEI